MEAVKKAEMPDQAEKVGNKLNETQKQNPFRALSLDSLSAILEDLCFVDQLAWAIACPGFYLETVKARYDIQEQLRMRIVCSLRFCRTFDQKPPDSVPTLGLSGDSIAVQQDDEKESNKKTTLDFACAADAESNMLCEFMKRRESLITGSWLLEHMYHVPALCRPAAAKKISNNRWRAEDVDLMVVPADDDFPPEFDYGAPVCDDREEGGLSYSVDVSFNSNTCNLKQLFAKIASRYIGTLKSAAKLGVCSEADISFLTSQEEEWSDSTTGAFLAHYLKSASRACFSYVLEHRKVGLRTPDAEQELNLQLMLMPRASNERYLLAKPESSPNKLCTSLQGVIAHDFDLDFCKVAWHPTQNGGRVQIWSLDSILQRRSDMHDINSSELRHLTQTTRRFCKYVQRGFHITNVDVLAMAHVSCQLDSLQAKRRLVLTPKGSNLLSTYCKSQALVGFSSPIEERLTRFVEANWEQWPHTTESNENNKRKGDRSNRISVPLHQYVRVPPEILKERYEFFSKPLNNTALLPLGQPCTTQANSSFPSTKKRKVARTQQQEGEENQEDDEQEQGDEQQQKIKRSRRH
jgi:hypothetical protein